MLAGRNIRVSTTPAPAEKPFELPRIVSRWAPAYMATIGAIAGFLGSVTSLVFNIAGAWLTGIEPLRLLRVYATIAEGAAALQPENNTFFLDTFLSHLAVGSFFGALFLLLSRRSIGARTFTRHLILGVAFGLCLWIANFYLILSWLQPMLNGEAFIVRNIPPWIGALTHACYGLTLALVSFPFRSDAD
jgi:hypothetical protein